MESASGKLSNKGDDQDGVKTRNVFSERTIEEKDQARKIASSKEQQDRGASTESFSKAGSTTGNILSSDQDPDVQSVSDVQQSDSVCPSKEGHNKADVSRHVLDKGSKTISGLVQIPFHAPENAAVKSNSQVRGEDEKHTKEGKRAVECSTSTEATESFVKSGTTLSYDNNQGNEGNCHVKGLSRTDAATARQNDKTKDVLKNSKGTLSNLSPSASNSEGSGFASVTGGVHLETSLSSDDSEEQSAKSADQYFLSHFGLMKISQGQKEAYTKAKDPIHDEVIGEDSSEKKVHQQTIAESVVKDCAAQVNISSEPKLLTTDQHVKVVSEFGSKLPTIRPVSDNISVAECDSETRNKDGQTAVTCSNNPTNATKTLPLYIKVKLEEKNMTIICCPFALLLQHKEKIDVTLRASVENVYSIKCRMCSHEVSKPYAMLQHLKAEHQIQGCLQKLLNLNSHHLGCMSRPSCVNIPSVLTLPEGLSDMEHGIIRFSSIGAPRLSFVCRLCPLNFHTARGLSSHHHYFMKFVLTNGQPATYNSKWMCKLCPQEFPSFLDYYIHHEWMRVAKDLFVNTDPVIKKKFEVMNESGMVVASVEVPRNHTSAIETQPDCNSDSMDDVGWGHTANTATNASANNNFDQSVTETAVCLPDSQIPSTIDTKTTTDSLRSKQKSEADEGKKIGPPLFQTLDNLCRKLVQKDEMSLTSFEMSSPAGDKQNVEEHEYMCAMCHKTFPRLAQMQGHMGSHARKHRVNKYAPSTPAGVTALSSDPPSDIDRPTAAGPKDVEYKCGVCSETFPKLNQMQIHMECHNRLHPATQSSMRSLDTAFSETVKLISLTCDICHCSFPTEHKLWDHRITHTKNKKSVEGDTGIHTAVSSLGSANDTQKKTVFLCVICNKTFAREVNLRFHLKQHATENLKNASNRSKEGLELNKPEADANQDRAVSVTQHVCVPCNRSFDSSMQLRSHLAWHTKVKRETNSPTVVPKQDGGGSKRSHTCNVCNKSNSSAWELRLHKKKHIKSQKLLVRRIMGSEESEMIKSRTLMHRVCNEKKKSRVSNQEESVGKITGKGKGRKGQSAYKYYCRNCNRYFMMNNHFVKHMAIHTHVESEQANKSKKNSSSRRRRSQTREVQIEKQKDGQLNSLSKACDDSSAVMEDMSQDTRPSSADEQQLEIGDKVYSKTSDRPSEKKDSEVAVNPTEDSSPPMVEDKSEDRKPSATEEGSPGSNKVSKETSIKPTGKQNSELSILSLVCEDKSSGMDDTSRGVRTIASEVITSEGDKELSLDSEIATHSTVFNHKGLTMEVASQETRPNACDTQSPDIDKEYSQMSDRHSHKKDGELSACLMICDKSSGVMENTNQETRPVIADAGPSVSPSIDKGHFQTSDEQMQKKPSNLTVQSTVCGDVSQETRPSATDTQSNKSPPSDEDNLQTSEVSTKKQQDDELTAHPAVCEDTSTLMEGTSQETRPSVSDAHVPQSSEANPQTSDEPIQKQDGELTTHLNAVIEVIGQETRPSSSDVQSPEIDKENSQTSIVSAQKQLHGELTSYSTDLDSNSVMNDTSQETRPSTSDVLSSESGEVHSQTSNGLKQKQDDELTAYSTLCDDSNAVMENRSQETRPIASDALPLDGSKAQTSIPTEKQEDNLTVHSTVFDDPCDVMENTNKETRSITSDELFTEKEKQHLPTSKVISSEQVCELTMLSTVCDNSNAVMETTRPSTSYAQSLESNKDYSETSKLSIPKLKGGELTALPTDCEGTNVAMLDMSRETRPSTSNTLFRKTYTEYKQTNKVPQQNQDSKCTAHLEDWDDFSAVMTESSQETRPSGLLVEDKIVNSGGLGNSDNLIKNLEVSEDESATNISVQETKVGGGETTRSLSGNEYSQTSKVHVSTQIQNDDEPAAYSKVADDLESGTSVGQETRPSGPDVQSQGNRSNNTGLSQIIEKLRQKLGSEPTAQYTGTDSSCTVMEDTSWELNASASDARTSGSDEGHSQDDDLSKHSSVHDNSSLVAVDLSQETSSFDDGKNLIDKTHSQHVEDCVGDTKTRYSGCERAYSNVNQLDAHKRVHIYANTALHKNKSIGRCILSKHAGDKLYGCEICPQTFKDYKKLCGHWGAHASHKMTTFKKHAESGDSGSEIKPQEANCEALKVTEPTLVGTFPEERGEYSCKFCDKSFHRLIQFRSHIMAAHPLAKGKLFLLRPFMCELCGKSFTKSRQRQIHMKLHVKTRRRRRFKKRMALLDSDSDHTYFKKLPTDTGNTSEKAAQSQGQEMENVTQRRAEDTTVSEVEAPLEKVYKCQLCEKSLQSQQQLAEHINIHKRYPCQFCDASFPLARQLCGHMKVHGGLRGINCGKNQSLNDRNQNYSSSVSGMKPSSSPLSKKTSRPVTRLTASSQSNALLKKVIKMYLSGVKTKKKRLGKGQRDLAKWFQPKRSLQRALTQSKQARIQKIYAVLRKSIILEIDADSHRLVYECKECKMSTLCHKAVLRHYLEKHLQKKEGKNETPPAASSGKEDSTPAPHLRFRNKSKIGCPICKGSSGFQCHLHNEDGLVYIDSLLENDWGKDLFACDKCEQRFPTHSKLVQHRQVHSKRHPGDPFSCLLCPFQAQSSHGLIAHQQVHRKKVEKKPADNSPKSKKQQPLICPLCPFKVKNIYALAAHSRIHKGGKGRKRLRPDNTPSLAPSPAPSPLPTEESTTISRNDMKLKKNSLKCFVCSKCFHTLPSYNKHIKMHKDFLRFKCDQCSRYFRSGQELHDHIIAIHSANNSYRCTKCAFSSLNKKSLQQHLKFHAGAKEKTDQKTNLPSFSNVVLKQDPCRDAAESERKAKWSAYLNEVLRTRVPGTDAADPDKSPVKEKSLSSSLTNQDGQISLDQVSIQKPNQDGSQSPKSLKPEDPTMKEAESKLLTDSEAQQPVGHREGSLQRLSDSPDEYFACSQCKNFQASTKEEWDSHMEVVHQNSPGSKHKCSMCQYTTVKEERLEQHVKLHRVHTLQCNTCPYRCPQRHLMIRHVQTVHKQHKPFQCKLCTYCTSYRHHLRRHSEKHKNPNFRCRYRKLMKKGDWHSAEALTSSSHVICNECGRELLNKKTLRNHYIKVHGRVPGANRQSGTPIIEPTLDTFEGPEAEQEKRKRSSFSVLPEDLIITSNEKMYECSVCSLMFKCRSDLNHHMAQGHAEAKASLPCQCPQCGLVTGSGQLQAHMLIHQEENLLVCDEEGCNFKTAESVHLQRHQTKHSAERDARNTCRFCQIKFPDTSSLRMHNIQNHSDQTRRVPFMCSHCPFTTSNEKDANRHFKLHNYNLPFKCVYCVFSSSTASAIATHQKIHRYPRRITSTAVVTKMTSQRQKIRSGASAKSADNQDSLASNVVPDRAHPKHVFVTNRGKKLYECRYCQRFFEVAEAWQRHELRHMAEWPQY